MFKLRNRKHKKRHIEKDGGDKKQFKEMLPMIKQNLSEKLIKTIEWSPEQNARYIVFIETKKEVFQGRKHSQLWNQYKKMAGFIKSRNFRQCKIYHQKLSQKFKTISNIIEYLLEGNLGLKNLVLNERKFLETHKTHKGFKSFPEQKEDKGENDAPTSIQYANQEINQLSQMNAFTFQLHKNKNFNNYTIPLIPIQEESYQKQCSSSIKQEWRECHQYFLQYWEKLSEIMSKTQQMNL